MRFPSPARSASAGPRPRRHATVASLAAASLVLAATGIDLGWAQSGNIGPAAIQIDRSADLWADQGTPLNGGATADWVRDTAPNTDTPSVINAEAVGLIPGVSSAVGGKGHWQGVRLVDGVAQGDTDIFLTGGKEDILSTWNVGAGSIGSSKYDVTQAYIANNQSDLFFGMERRGNNGTTAFDFEFNRSSPAGGLGSYLPTRTQGDVLLTFEMSGSGSSGSATPHYYTWDGSRYVERTRPSSLISTINSTPTKSAPWGHVDSHGTWSLSDLDRFELAEASVNIASVFPDLDVCGDSSSFVQVRTRSSATSTSDLKDTTKIFSYRFDSPPPPGTQLAATCTQQFTYASTTDSTSYDWRFTPPSGVTLSGTGVEGPDTKGAYRSTQRSGTVSVSLPSGVGSASIAVTQRAAAPSGCASTDGPYTVTVYRTLGATATVRPLCDNTLAFSSTVSGGNAPYSYSWRFERSAAADGSGPWTAVGSSTAAAGTFDAGAPGSYRGVLTVTDSAAPSAAGVTGKPACTATATSTAVNVYDEVTATVAATPDCDNTFGYRATAAGGKPGYTYAFTLKKRDSTGRYVTATTFSVTGGPSVSGTLDTAAAGWAVGGAGTYRLSVTVSDSSSPACTVTVSTSDFDVLDPLNATATKTGADGTNLAALVSGTSGAGASLQWQRSTDGGATWTNIGGATSATLAYSSFEADVAWSAVAFDLAGDSYAGKQWTVQLRLHASRTVGGNLCTVDSDPVTVKKITAVDP